MSKSETSQALLHHQESGRTVGSRKQISKSHKYRCLDGERTNYHRTTSNWTQPLQNHRPHGVYKPGSSVCWLMAQDEFIILSELCSIWDGRGCHHMGHEICWYVRLHRRWSFTWYDIHDRATSRRLSFRIVEGERESCLVFHGAVVRTVDFQSRC